MPRTPAELHWCFTSSSNEDTAKDRLSKRAESIDQIVTRFDLVWDAPDHTAYCGLS